MCVVQLITSSSRKLSFTFFGGDFFSLNKTWKRSTKTFVTVTTVCRISNELENGSGNNEGKQHIFSAI